MIRIDRILCPTDFSEASRRALGEAVTLARWYAAEVTVLYVAPFVAPAAAEAAYVPLGGLTAEARQRLLGELQALVAPARATGVAMRVDVAEGDPVAEILSRTRSDDADLVVLGTRGREGVERWMLGSVAERVLRRAECPVLTVAPAAEGVPSAWFETVLCPVDFTASSEHTVHEAAALAEEAHARLILLHVIEGSTYPPIRVPPGFDASIYRPEVEAAVSGRLGRMLPEGRRTAELTVVWGAADAEILREARERHAGIIVMGAHGGPLESTLFGSTAYRVVRKAACPVLVVRARAHGFAEKVPELAGLSARN
jgi:nucleotide-binding universal stress UspA family protein